MDAFTTQKSQILNREAAIIAELLTSGLENIRRISKGHAFYYQSFYALSMGLERLMKLVLHIEQPRTNPRNHGHDLELLSQTLGVNFPDGSLEKKALVFLSDFSKGDRYSIIDFLSQGNSTHLVAEPVIKFYETILKEILILHPPRPLWTPPNFDFAAVLHTREDLTLINNLSGLTVHSQVIEHASKYCVIYMSHVARPFINRLNSHDGPPRNPYFSEHFRYLSSYDKYYLTRKKFRS